MLVFFTIVVATIKSSIAPQGSGYDIKSSLSTSCLWGHCIVLLPSSKTPGSFSLNFHPIQKTKEEKKKKGVLLPHSLSGQTPHLCVTSGLLADAERGLASFPATLFHLNFNPIYGLSFSPSHARGRSNYSSSGLHVSRLCHKRLCWDVRGGGGGDVCVCVCVCVCMCVMEMKCVYVYLECSCVSVYVIHACMVTVCVGEHVLCLEVWTSVCVCVFVYLPYMCV